MTISLEEEQQGEDEMQDVAANVDTFDDGVPKNNNIMIFKNNQIKKLF